MVLQCGPGTSTLPEHAPDKKTLTPIIMKKETKEKIKTALVVAGTLAASYIAFELLRAFMWVCHDAGIPM